MRWWELVLDYLKVLAWPAVVVTAVLVLKEQIRNLVTRVSSASLPGDITVSFSGARDALADAKGQIGAPADAEAEGVTDPHSGPPSPITQADTLHEPPPEPPELEPPGDPRQGRHPVPTSPDLRDTASIAVSKMRHPSRRAALEIFGQRWRTVLPVPDLTELALGTAETPQAQVGAIVLGAAQVEAFVNSVAFAFGAAPSHSSPVTALRRIDQVLKISAWSSLADALRPVWEVRNRAVHDSRIRFSAQTVLEFFLVADEVCLVIADILRRLNTREGLEPT